MTPERRPAAKPAKKKSPARVRTRPAGKDASTPAVAKAPARKKAPPVAPPPPPTIRTSIEVFAPPYRVWAAVTSPDEVNRWFTERCEFEQRRGGRVLLYWNSRDPGAPAYVEKSRFGNAVEARVETWEPPRGFALRPGSLWPGLVQFRLEPVPAGTRLTVDHTGWSAKDAWFKTVERDWTLVLDLLKQYLEKPEAEYDAYLAKREPPATA